MFEHMKIAETVYEGVVKTFLQKTTRTDDNNASNRSQMRGESASSKIYFNMGKLIGKYKQMYVDHPRDISILTYLINGPGNS